MIEALLDPKTWLFALFSALDNVPNSLTNQRQIIVTSFGFTPLQTTLLGCVDGVIEIVTIFTGVNIAARIPNSIAYVGVLYMVPNLMGVFLINFLPWSNKVGLLFSVWTTGTSPILSTDPTLYIFWIYWHPTGVGTTGFVLSLSWLSNVTAGHTKRVTTNAIMLSAYCIGNSAGPFMWQQKYKPRSAREIFLSFGELPQTHSILLQKPRSLDHNRNLLRSMHVIASHHPIRFIFREQTTWQWTYRRYLRRCLHREDWQGGADGKNQGRQGKVLVEAESHERIADPKVSIRNSWTWRIFRIAISDTFCNF